MLTDEMCNVTYVDASVGYVTSPHYPWGYGSTRVFDCALAIHVPPGGVHVLRVTAVDFDLRSGDNKLTIEDDLGERHFNWKLNDQQRRCNAS